MLVCVCVEMDGNGWKWMEMDGNGWKWMEMDGNGWKWMEMDGNGWKCGNYIPSISCVNIIIYRPWELGILILLIPDL